MASKSEGNLALKWLGGVSVPAMPGVYYCSNHTVEVSAREQKQKSVEEKAADQLAALRKSTHISHFLSFSGSFMSAPIVYFLFGTRG